MRRKLSKWRPLSGLAPGHGRLLASVTLLAARGAPATEPVLCREGPPRAAAHGPLCEGLSSCAIPTIFTADVDDGIELAVKELERAQRAASSAERVAHLEAAQVAYANARTTLGDQCNPNLLVSWARVSRQLGRLKEAAEQLLPLQCVLESELPARADCALVSYADAVRSGRALAREIEEERRPLLLLDLHPAEAQVTLATTSGADQRLPEPIDREGHRRLPPGKYVFRLSAPGYEPKQVESHLDYDGQETLRESLSPLQSQDSSAPRRGGVVAIGAILLDEDPGGAGAVLGSYCFGKHASAELGPVFTSSWLGPMLNLGTSFGERWFGGVRVGGSLLFPRGAAPDESPGALAGLHAEVRGGYGERGLRGFMNVSAELFPASDEKLTWLFGAGALWSFFGPRLETD